MVFILLLKSYSNYHTTQTLRAANSISLSWTVQSALYLAKNIMLVGKYYLLQPCNSQLVLNYYCSKELDKGDICMSLVRIRSV